MTVLVWFQANSSVLLILSTELTKFSLNLKAEVIGTKRNILKYLVPHSNISDNY